jgi:hypothetical protein
MESISPALPADQTPSPIEFQAPVIDQNPLSNKKQIKRLAGITG